MSLFHTGTCPHLCVAGFWCASHHWSRACCCISLLSHKHPVNCCFLIQQPPSRSRGRLAHNRRPTNYCRGVLGRRCWQTAVGGDYLTNQRGLELNSFVNQRMSSDEICCIADMVFVYTAVSVGAAVLWQDQRLQSPGMTSGGSPPAGPAAISPRQDRRWPSSGRTSGGSPPAGPAAAVPQQHRRR